jgi:hypothetical protein
VTDADVDALYFLQRADASWAELYKVGEALHAAIGSDEIVARGWASEAELRLFRKTANHQDAAGRDARHARKAGKDAPSSPMALEEARELIRRIVFAWLTEKA